MRPPLGIGGPVRRVSIASVVFTPARGVIHPSFPLRGRWERSAKSCKQAPSPSLVSLNSSSDETRLHYQVMHGSGQLSTSRANHLSVLLCVSYPSRPPQRSAPKPDSKFKSEPTSELQDDSRNSRANRDMHRTKSQNPGYRTPKHPALSVFSEMLAQNGACDLFAMEQSCAAGFHSASSAQPFASSPARSPFSRTRPPCFGVSPSAAAIATAQNPKSTAAARRCASPRNTRTVGGPLVAPSRT